jgi:hypothetical protein
VGGPGDPPAGANRAIPPDGHPVSELAELYTAARPDLRLLVHRVVGSGGVVRRITAVDYPMRTWMSRTTHQAEISSLADNPALLRAEIAQGWWGVPRHARLGGRPAIELIWRESPAPNAWPVGQPGLQGELRRTLWVDGQTYLPIGQRIQLAGKRPGAQPYAVTADYRLLPPTTANLAKLHPVIPKGFTRTQVSAAVLLPGSPPL